MTIFVGSFQHTDLFHRVLTVLACSSIVITAVYILRMVGKFLLGKINNEHFEHLKDATWYERISVVTLLFFMFALGSAPFWISDMIHHSVLPVINQLVK
jgi:NADH-quinone oxidoreductase subunit M